MHEASINIFLPLHKYWYEVKILLIAKQSSELPNTPSDLMTKTCALGHCKTIHLLVFFKYLLVEYMCTSSLLMSAALEWRSCTVLTYANIQPLRSLSIALGKMISYTQCTAFFMYRCGMIINTRDKMSKNYLVIKGNMDVFWSYATGHGRCSNRHICKRAEI